MLITNEQLAINLQKKLAHIYCVYGDEPLLLQEACDQIRKTAIQQGFSERIKLSIENTTDWQSFQNVAYGGSLFGSKNLIEINTELAKLGELGNSLLQKYCETLPTNQILLLIIPEKINLNTKKTSSIKAIEKIGIIVQIKTVYANHFPRWIQQRAQQFSLQIDAQGVNLLAQYMEGNLLAAANEIEKLAILYGKSSLNAEQILESISDSAQFTIFNLADNVLAGDLTKSIRILNILQQTKTEPILVLWAITKELRTLIKISSIEQNQNLDSAMQQHGVWEQRRHLVKSALQRHSLTALQTLLQKCAEVDYIIKTSNTIDIWHELSRMILLLSRNAEPQIKQ